MNKLFVAAILISSLFLMSGTASAELTCTQRQASCLGGELDLLQISDTSNAHASKDGSYFNKVCCSGVTGLGNSCSGNYDVVMRLSDPTNAHVGNKTYIQYTNQVCLSAPTGTIVGCLFQDQPCSGDYKTMGVSVSDDTNAHIGDYNAYTKKVCCKAFLDITPPTVTLNSPADGFPSKGAMSFNCTAADNVGVSNVTLYGNWTGSWAAIETNSSPVNGIPTVFSKTVSPDGTYKWNCRACDPTGNCAFASTNRTFQIDNVKPTITMSMLSNPPKAVPPYTSADFNLSWSANEPIQNSVLYYSNTTPDSWQPASTLCDMFIDSGKTGHARCNITKFSSGAPYNFNLSADDMAGNNNYSNIVTVSIDGLQTSRMVALPKWMSSYQPNWIPDTRSFNISWAEASHIGAPISCFKVRWINTTIGSMPPAVGSWNNLPDSTGGACFAASQQWTIFNESNGDVRDNITYWFTVQAIDLLGNEEAWNISDASRVANTTIDTIPPLISTNVTDQDGRPAGPVVTGEDVRSINISAKSSDTISGIANTSILLWITERNKIYPKECASQGDSAQCSSSFDEDTQIRYQATAKDNALNPNSTVWNYVVTHPISNFIIHDQAVTFGMLGEAKVQVRNIRNSADDITLSLIGYPAQFVNRENDANLLIEQGGYIASVTNLQPFEERVISVELLSSDAGTHNLNLNATSFLTGETDTDAMKITVNYPPTFPALEGWAAALIMLAAGGLYYTRKNLSV